MCQKHPPRAPPPDRTPPRRSLVFARASTKDDESAFYCSVCSGWFVASEPRVDGDDRAAEAPGGGDARAQPAQKAVPTPREIYAGLDECVVGPRDGRSGVKPRPLPFSGT